MTSSTADVGARRRAPSKGDRREQAILEVARELLKTRAIAQIPIDELASGAGISRSSFYFYFDSKQAVLAALLGEISVELAEENAAWLDGTGPDEPALRAATRHSVELWTRSGNLLTQAYAASPDDGEIGTWFAGVMQRGTDRLAARIERDRAAGLAPEGPDARALARMVLGLKREAIAEQRPDRSADDVVDDLVVATLRLVYGRAGPTDSAEVGPERSWPPPDVGGGPAGTARVGNGGFEPPTSSV